MTDVYTLTVCVCERPIENDGEGGSPRVANRPTEACVCPITHGAAAVAVRSPTHSRIQYNYIQRTERGTNRVCIQTDYTGGDRRAGT